MKKVLITGANSYIGTSFEKYVKENYDFSGYDSVFHVAGIAHFSKDESKKELYYKVNTELTEEVAKIAKQQRVNQFIFMSSIIVYGDSTNSQRIITKDTQPSPSDFYGDSKWQAEQRLNKLSTPSFNIVILRLPMIYGKGSKGNYPRLSKLSKTLPIFPKIENQRSMLHIDNLCECIRQVIERGESGVFFPQNKEYVCTYELVGEIAASQGKKVYLISVFNPIIKLLFGLDTVKKVFGNLVYDQEMSHYDFDYQVTDFEESIRLTER